MSTSTTDSTRIFPASCRVHRCLLFHLTEYLGQTEHGQRPLAAITLLCTVYSPSTTRFYVLLRLQPIALPSVVSLFPAPASSLSFLGLVSSCFLVTFFSLQSALSPPIFCPIFSPQYRLDSYSPDPIPYLVFTTSRPPQDHLKTTSRPLCLADTCTLQTCTLYTYMSRPSQPHFLRLSLSLLLFPLPLPSSLFPVHTPRPRPSPHPTPQDHPIPLFPLFCRGLWVSLLACCLRSTGTGLWAGPGPVVCLPHDATK